jgi:hypothetical protein
MIANCQCKKCSQMLAFEADDVGATVSCPNCGSDTQLVSPSIPPANGEKVDDGEFYVWLDDKAEGPFQSQQLIDLAKQFPEMAWSFAGGSEWNRLADFQKALEKVRQKDLADKKTAKLKALRIQKKEVQELKRQLSAQMTALRNEARRQSSGAGGTWLGLYDSELAASQRRGIRQKKEALILPLEQKKSIADGLLAQIDKQILELEAG